MTAERKLKRAQRTKQDDAKLKMGARALLVAERLFDGQPPTVAALKIRVALGLQLIRLGTKAQMKDMDGVIKQVRLGYVTYDEKRDGPSDFMRWWKQVIEQRALEEQWHVEQTAKKRAFVKPEEKSDG